MPRDRRISTPAPSTITKGTTPKMKANDVIRIGRRRSRDGSKVASRGAAPASRCLVLLRDEAGRGVDEPEIRQHQQPGVDEEGDHAGAKQASHQPHIQGRGGTEDPVEQPEEPTQDCVEQPGQRVAAAAVRLE
jgi:hypothetical protein